MCELSNIREDNGSVVFGIMCSQVSALSGVRLDIPSQLRVGVSVCITADLCCMHQLNPLPLCAGTESKIPVNCRYQYRSQAIGSAG